MAYQIKDEPHTKDTVFVVIVLGVLAISLLVLFNIDHAPKTVESFYSEEALKRDIEEYNYQQYKAQREKIEERNRRYQGEKK